MNAPTSPELLARLSQLGERPDVRPRAPTAADAHHALGWPQQQEIDLCIVGFQASERVMLDSLVRLSRRRGLTLNLLPVHEAHQADVIMIDGADPLAREWGMTQGWLERRAVIWVNHRSENATHLSLCRPILWPVLPMALERAMRKVVPATRALVLRSIQPQAPMVMVVAEDSDVRLRLRGKLEAAGCRATGVRTAREGLAALHAAPYAGILVAGEVYDADRLEVCRQLKSLEPFIGHVPLLVFDGEAGPLERWRARWAGCEAVIPEPERGRDIRRLLDKHRQSSAARTADEFAPVLH